ncbi:MAG: hypothetical protein OEM52_11820 [bacterium]|nr:hypothetical protein [bacterium]
MYYRLNVVNLRLPSLRERRSDVPLLTHYFLKKFANRAAEEKPKQITADAMKQLLNYDWPGNIRELENTIERAYVLSSPTTIRSEDLSLPSQGGDEDAKHRTLKDYEREVVIRTLEECGGNRTKTAEILDVSIRWLHYKLNEWKVDTV